MEISKICERIKERRKELGMTQKELADVMHVSNQLISKWETGESVPTLEYLQQLSEALQTSVQFLMGENETAAPAESAPSAPSEPKQKAPSKVKSFWKAHRKQLIISIISVAAALLILMFALLSVYVFAPSAGKEKYFERIDKGIDKYLELGYFNIKGTTEVDGEEDKNPRILQGYIDENGDAAYYNSVTDEVVKNKVLTYKKKTGQRMYVQPESIKTVPDLLKELLKNWGEEDDDFDIDENVSYIRKSGSVYYLEFTDEYFLGEMTPSEKKNIELTEKIKGRVEMDGDITKSIEISVRYRNMKDNENFSIDSKIKFIQEKPEIKHNAYVETVAGYADKWTFLEKLNAVTLYDSMDSDLRFDLRHRGASLRFENGYAFILGTYSLNHDTLTLYDPQTLVKQQTISLKHSLGDATVYGGSVWFADSYQSGKINLYRYDLQTEKEELVLTTAGTFFKFNGKYMYSNRNSSSEKSVVFDLETEREQFVSEYVRYVDREGRIYCATTSDGSLHLYGSDTALQGTEVVKEEDGFVYMRDGSEPTVLYKYKAGLLQDTVTLPSDKAVCVGDYSYVPNSNAVYDKDGNTVVTFSDMALSSDDYAGYLEVPNIKILAAWNDYIFVGFSVYQSGYNEYVYTYFGFYRVGEWDAPVAYTDKIRTLKKVETAGTEERTYLLLDGMELDVLLLRP